MTFHLLITKDCIDNGERNNQYCRNVPSKKTRKEIRKHGEKWRLKDDDGNIYFYGFIIMDDDCTGFEPLEVLGYGYGCTIVEYRRNKVYEVL